MIGGAFAESFQEVSCIQINVRTNERIRAPEVLVIGPDGTKLGVLKTRDAIALAQEQYDMDLVEVSPNTTPPVCRIMDYGRWKYEQEQRLKKAKKHQTQVQIKEIKLRPKIGEHDFQVKLKHLIEFLNKGAKVKITLRFRGREIVHTDIAERILRRLADEVQDIGIVEAMPKMDGRTMVMMLAPKAKKEASKPEPEADEAGTSTE